MTDVPLVTQHTIVSMAARGRRTQDIVDRTSLPTAVVRQIAEGYGAPDLGRLARAAEQLRKQLDEHAPTSTRGAAVAEGLDAIKADAERIGSSKLVRRAERIGDLLDQLRVDLRAERTAWEARAAERAKLKAEAARIKAEREGKVARLAELEAEAARIKAELRGKPRPAVVVADAATVRAWAARAGVECPSMGPVPKSVRQAYEARGVAA